MSFRSCVLRRWALEMGDVEAKVFRGTYLEEPMRRFAEKAIGDLLDRREILSGLTLVFNRRQHLFAIAAIGVGAALMLGVCLSVSH